MNWTWERTFHALRAELEYRNNMGDHNDSWEDVSERVDEALVRRVDADREDPNIRILPSEELESVKEMARREGYNEGYEEAEDAIANHASDGSERLTLENVIVEHSICMRCTDARADSLHHIIPRARSGGDDLENRIPLCDDCHDRVEILTEKCIEKFGASRNELEGYIKNGFPLEAFR